MREFVNTTLLEPLTTIGTRILHFLPNLFAAVIILGVGWFLARLLGRGVARLLRMLGIDHLGDQLGISAVLTRARLMPLPSHLAGRMLSWVLVVLTAIATVGDVALE